MEEDRSDLVKTRHMTEEQTERAVESDPDALPLAEEQWTKAKTFIPFSRARDQLMQNAEFRREYDALEDEFSLIRQAVAARTKAGKTQAQVAEAMGVSQPAIAKIEAGKVKNLDVIRRYAKALGCSVRVELVPTRAELQR